MTCSYRWSSGAKRRGYWLCAKELGPSLNPTGRAGKMQLNSAWRNGAKKTDQNGQQQKTTQEQRQLAHWNLYSCDAGMGTLSALG